MERFFRQVYNFSPRGHIKSESLGKEMEAMSQKNNKPCNEFNGQGQQAQQKSQSKQANGKSSGSGASGKSNSEFSSNG